MGLLGPPSFAPGKDPSKGAAPTCPQFMFPFIHRYENGRAIVQIQGFFGFSRPIPTSPPLPPPRPPHFLGGGGSHFEAFYFYCILKYQPVQLLSFAISLLLFSLHYSLRASLLREMMCVFGGYHILAAFSAPLEEDLTGEESLSEHWGFGVSG